jgi:hypothetical protein
MPVILAKPWTLTGKELVTTSALAGREERTCRKPPLLEVEAILA